MKDIVLKITGKTLSTIPKPPEGMEEEPMEFITEGKLSTRGTVTRISYDETPLSGMEGCKTSLIIRPGKVLMKRVGEDKESETVMQFEKGKRHVGIYDTPYGPIRIKTSAGYGTARSKWEYDDLAAAAKQDDVPLRHVISGISKKTSE